MDRQIIWVGAIPLDTDLLSTNKNMMLAISKLAEAMFGTSTTGFTHGLAVAPTGPATLTVNVGPGEIYAVENVDNSAFGSIAADTTHQIVKQGINLNTTNLNTPAPVTAGYSVNYLIEASFTEADGGSTVLPYYNSSNPGIAYSGPGNAGTPNYTVRACSVTLVAKAGAAATTGTQTTPAPDSGYVGIAVVTVANGQASVTSGNITPYANAPVIGVPLTNGRKLNIQTFSTAGTFTYTPTPGTTRIEVEVLGGGGGAGGAAVTGASTASAGANGSAGGYCKSLILTGFAGAAIVVGAAGAGGVGVAGGNGGNSSFGGTVVGGGGPGGTVTTSTLFPFGVGATAAGGTATGGNILNVPGAIPALGLAINSSTILGQPGANSIYGAGGLQIQTSNSNGSAATGYGAGGSGGTNAASQGTTKTGGNGSPGIVIIHEYA